MAIDYGAGTYGFDRLVEKEHMLRCAAFNIVGDWDRASDVVQDAYVKGLRALRGDNFRGESGLFTWLYKITVNSALDAVRERRRFVDVGDLNALAGIDVNPCDEVAETDEQLYRSKVVAEALAAIPEEQCVALRLRYFLGQDYEAMAETLHVPVGTVKSRVHSGKKKLKRMLEQIARAA